MRYHFDSKNRHNGTIGNFTMNLSKDIPSGKYILDHIQFYSSFYTVNSKNHTVSYTDTASRSVTLTHGFYSASDLGTHIASKMSTESGSLINTFSSSFSSATGKFTFTANINAFTFNIDSTTALSLLGFDEDSTQSSSLTQTSEYVVNLSYPDTIFMKINNYTGIVTQRSSATFIIPILFHSKFINCYQYNEPVQIDTINYLEVTMFDDQGNILDFEGVNFKFVLRTV